MNLPTRLAYLSSHPLMGLPARLLLRLLGTQMPPTVKIGKGLGLMHGAMGTVIHGETIIGNNVSIFHGVTIGRADAYLPRATSQFGGVLLDDGAFIGAGAAILCKRGLLTIGKNAIVGANAVVLCSVGDNEIWAGNPATRVGIRQAAGPEGEDPTKPVKSTRLEAASMMPAKRILILHETDGRPYFHALEQMAREKGSTVEFYGASILRRLLGAIPKRTISLRMLKESWTNLLFRFRQFSVGEGVVVACFAPYDFRMLYFLPLWLKRRLIVIEHTSWPYWWTARVPRKGGVFRGFLARLYYQWLRRRVDRIVAVLAECKQQLATRPGLLEKCVVIPHTNRMVLLAGPPRTEPLKILFVGKLLPEKGVAEYLRVADKLHSAAMTFTVVGYGTMEPEVADAAGRGVVTFHRKVSDSAALSAIYAQHDILVVPSVSTPRWEELFGIVIIEAMAHGVVPIASNHVGPRNIITDGVDGIVVRGASTAEIETNLLCLAADHEKLLLMRRHAQENAKAYALDAVSKQWSMLFDEFDYGR